MIIQYMFVRNKYMYLLQNGYKTKFYHTISRLFSKKSNNYVFLFYFTNNKMLPISFLFKRLRYSSNKMHYCTQSYQFSLINFVLFEFRLSILICFCTPCGIVSNFRVHKIKFRKTCFRLTLIFIYRNVHIKSILYS